MVLLCFIKGEYKFKHPNIPLYQKFFFLQRKLQEPVVSCALGKLYNKDSIIEYLLDKSAYGDGQRICGHIRSLKVCPKFFLGLIHFIKLGN